MPTQLTFNVRKTTEGCVVFKEDDDHDAIGSLYVRKAFLGRNGHADATTAIVTIDFE